MEAFIARQLSRLATGEALELRAIRERPHAAHQYIGTDPKALLAFARFYDKEGYNLYYGLAPRREGAKHGRRESLTRATCLWADLDAKDYATGKDGALDAVQSCILAPTLLIDSGGGYQAVWELEEDIAPEDFDALERLVKRLVAFLGADTNAPDVTRIFRLPGSHNYKYEPSRPVVVMQDFDSAYQLAELLEIFPEPPPEPPAPPPPRPVEWDHDGPELEEIEDALYAIPPRAVSYEEWVRILMALHSALPDEVGLTVAEHWGDGFPGEIAAKWRSFRREGSTVATVFHFARQFGWQPPAVVPFEWEAPDPKASGEGPGARPKARKLTIITAREFLAKTYPERRWLVQGLLPASSLSLLAAKPKLGKSQLALNLGWAVATGKDFLGRATTKGKVLYISYEQGDEGLHPLYTRLVPSYAPADADLDDFGLHAGFKGVPETIEELADRFADSERYDLIVLDPLSKAIDITDGNNYQEVYKKLDPVLEFALTHRTHVCAIHHSHKAVSEGADAVMGSTAFTGAVEVIMMLRKDVETGNILFSSTNRWTAAIPEMVLEFDEETRHATMLGGKAEVTTEQAKVRIMGYLTVAGETTEKDLKTALAPFPDYTIGLALRDLVAIMRVHRSADRPALYRAVSWSRPASEIADAQYELQEAE